MQQAQLTSCFNEVEPGLLFCKDFVQLEVVEEVSIGVELEVEKVVVFAFKGPLQLGHETLLLVFLETSSGGLSIHLPPLGQTGLADHLEHKHSRQRRMLD